MKEPSLVFIQSEETAFWRGGMSPALIAEVNSLFQANGCSVRRLSASHSFERLEFSGPSDALLRAAGEAHIPIVGDAAISAALSLPKILAQIDQSTSIDLPTTVDQSVYDYDRFEWMPYRHHKPGATNVAIRCQNRFGVKSYYVQVRDKLVGVKGELTAVYMAGVGTELCEYDSKTKLFKTKVRVPYLYAVPLCLCSGTMPTPAPNGGQEYRNVASEVAGVVLERLGQRTKTTIYWLT